eukprot:snap_masked-scaffold_11-processed-gene-11.2-mRNA-1 protein AED:1.00 eAED:1.00 QI:0/0/0/0/1/1/2/0/85
MKLWSRTRTHAVIFQELAWCYKAPAPNVILGNPCLCFFRETLFDYLKNYRINHYPILHRRSSTTEKILHVEEDHFQRAFLSEFDA